MSKFDEKRHGLKVTILGLHFTLIGLAIDPGYPFFVVGLAISAVGFAIE